LEVQQQLARMQRTFPSKAAYTQFVERQHATSADMLLRAKLSLLVEKIQRTVERRAGVVGASESRRNAVMRQFARDFKAQWKSKTRCRAAFVVPACSRYRAPRTSPAFVPPRVPLAG
jgi:hypothetical protein